MHPSGAVLEGAVRKAELAAQESAAAAAAAAETAAAAGKESDYSVKLALASMAGKGKVDRARGLVETMKETTQAAAGRTTEDLGLRDALTRQREKVKANDLAEKLYQEWQARGRLVAMQNKAQEKAADAEKARETLDTDKRRRDRRAAAARRRRAEGAEPLPQNAAGKLVYPSWHSMAGQEIQE